MSQVLNITQLGDPALRQIAPSLTHPSEAWVQTLIDDLIATLKQHNGVGIAAPQVNQSCRLLIVASHPNARYPDAPAMDPVALINPQISDHADRCAKDWEGCLSVPGFRGLVPRWQWVEVDYYDRWGNPQQVRFNDFVARIFQHEFDHLNGKVFLDRVEGTIDLMTEQEWSKRILKATNP